MKTKTIIPLILFSVLFMFGCQHQQEIAEDTPKDTIVFKYHIENDTIIVRKNYYVLTLVAGEDSAVDAIVTDTGNNFLGHSELTILNQNDSATVNSAIVKTLHAGLSLNNNNDSLDNLLRELLS